MPHREDAEQEAAIEDIGLFLNGIAELFDAVIDFLRDDQLAIAFGDPSTQALQSGYLLAAGAVYRITGHFIGQRVEAGECRRKDHAGIVAQRVRQRPAVWKFCTLAGGLIAEDEGDAGISQCVDAYGNGELSYAIESRVAIGGNTELIFQVKRSSAARQLDDVGNIGDGLERAAVLSLHQACDVLIQHQLPEANGDGLDELLAAEEAGDVGII